MNCQQCQKSLYESSEGKLPERMKVEVEAHLAHCEECKRVNSLLMLSENVIQEEKRFRPEPFLFTRVLSQIEKAEQIETQFIPTWRRIVSPIMVSLTIIAALYIGITAGSKLMQSPFENEIPAELTYFNDAAMESVYAFNEN